MYIHIWKVFIITNNTATNASGYTAITIDAKLDTAKYSSNSGYTF